MLRTRLIRHAPPRRLDCHKPEQARVRRHVVGPTRGRPAHLVTKLEGNFSKFVRCAHRCLLCLLVAGSSRCWSTAPTAGSHPMARSQWAVRRAGGPRRTPACSARPPAPGQRRARRLEASAQTATGPPVLACGSGQMVAKGGTDRATFHASRNRVKRHLDQNRSSKRSPNSDPNQPSFEIGGGILKKTQKLCGLDPDQGVYHMPKIFLALSVLCSIGVCSHKS